MPTPAPPQIEEAFAQLRAAIQQVDKKGIDAIKTPWSEVETSVVKLLGGGFRLAQPEHQVIALGLAGMLGERLNAELKAFWFPQRDALEGAAMGFPDALIMLSPFGAVTDALSSAKLSKLDGVVKEIRGALAKVKFSVNASQAALSPVDYQRLFDPGFIQIASVNPTKLTQAFNMTPDQLGREIRDALGRGGQQLPPEIRQQLEGQLVGSLARLEAGKPLALQIERAPRVAELVGHLFGTQSGTGSAPEEFWSDIALPLLFIGAPETFPPIEKDELDALAQGAEPLLLFLDVVPYQAPAPEEGLLGAFPVEKVSVPHEGFGNVPTLRVFKVDPEQIKAQLEKFDPAKTRQSMAKFSTILEE
ncbi:MAG: hypothetical protein ACT4TC_09630, partial [Myxococcaceae bacterium]